MFPHRGVVCLRHRAVPYFGSARDMRVYRRHRSDAYSRDIATSVRCHLRIFLCLKLNNVLHNTIDTTDVPIEIGNYRSAASLLVYNVVEDRFSERGTLGGDHVDYHK